jgi:nuclease S1
MVFMAMKRLLLVLAMQLSLPAWGFGAFVHETISDIAESKLSPVARANIKQLMQHAPRKDWIALSTWADQLRDDPQATEVERNTARWHYMNFPPGQCNLAIRKACVDGECLVPVLQQQLSILSDLKQAPVIRAKALAFVVHFYGDLHQPLHLGFAKDKGGNDFQIRIDGYPVTASQLEQQRAGSNLHALWDSLIFIKPKRTQAETATALAALKPNAAMARTTDIESIARESCALVQAKDFYPTQRKLNEAYLSQIRPKAEMRVALAAARLAKLLNRALRVPETPTHPSLAK